jgi:hypothetical protein
LVILFEMGKPTVTTTTRTTTVTTTMVESPRKFVVYLETKSHDDGNSEWSLRVDTKSRGYAKMRKFRQALEEKTGARPHGFGSGSGPSYYDGKGEFPAELLEMAVEIA